MSFTGDKRDEPRSFVWRCKNCSLVAGHGRPIAHPPACEQCGATDFEEVGPVMPPHDPVPGEHVPAWERSG